MSLRSIHCSFLGEVACCSTSDSAYSLFLRSVVCLSSVRHTRAPCLNRSTDLHAIWQLHLRCSVTHCVRRGSVIPGGRGDFGIEPAANTCIRLLHQGAAPISDFALYRITLATCLKLLSVRFSVCVFWGNSKPTTCHISYVYVTNSCMGEAWFPPNAKPSPLFFIELRKLTINHQNFLTINKSLIIKFSIKVASLRKYYRVYGGKKTE